MKPEKLIHIYKPYLPIPRGIEHAIKALESTWISSQGFYLDAVTEKIKDYFGLPYVIMCSNGTAAIHLISRGLKYKYPNLKHIIVPNNVFIAAISGFLIDKEYILHCVDADLNTFNYDLDKLDEELFKWKDEQVACLVVHNMGGLVNVPALKRKHPAVVFIEDSAEGILGKMEDKWAGTDSFACGVSGYSNKSLGSGETGWVGLHAEDVFQHLWQLHNQGQIPGKRFQHKFLGYNYKLSNVHAALYFSAICMVDEIVALKKKIFDRYRQAINEIEFCYNQLDAPGTINANWLFSFRIDSSISRGFDHLEAWFREKNIETRPLFYEFSTHDCLVNNPLIELCDGPIAKEINRTGVVLPSYPELTSEQQEYIIETLQEYIKLLKEESANKK